jgi:hypothetical protein
MSLCHLRQRRFFNSLFFFFFPPILHVQVDAVSTISSRKAKKIREKKVCRGEQKPRKEDSRSPHLESRRFNARYVHELCSTEVFREAWPLFLFQMKVFANTPINY